MREERKQFDSSAVEHGLVVATSDVAARAFDIHFRNVASRE
jgi:hypothetical protein